MLLLITLLFACGSLGASADAILQLPANLEIVEEEAFYGSTSLEKIVLSENVYHTSVRLPGFSGPSGKLTVQQYNTEEKLKGTDSYAPAAEIDLKFECSEDLDHAVISWSKENGTLFFFVRKYVKGMA